MAIEVKIPKVRCKDCGYTWVPRIPKPTWCPKCLHTNLELIGDAPNDQKGGVSENTQRRSY